MRASRRLIAFAAVAALVGAACGSDDDSDSATADTEATTETTDGGEEATTDTTEATTETTEATTAPSSDPTPPTMMTIKAVTITEWPMNGLTETSGAVSAPAIPASPAPMNMAIRAVWVIEMP